MQHSTVVDPRSSRAPDCPRQELADIPFGLPATVLDLPRIVRCRTGPVLLLCQVGVLNNPQDICRPGLLKCPRVVRLPGKRPGNPDGSTIEKGNKLRVEAGFLVLLVPELLVLLV